MARKRSLTGAQQMGFARGNLNPADFNPDEYNSYDAQRIRSTKYAPPRTVTPAPQGSSVMSSLAGVGQDREMSNRVVGSMTGSAAAPTPTAGTSPDFSLAAIGANAAGAFPADSGLTDRTGTSGAVGSYTGPPDIYGWEDGVKSGTVNRLDNGRSWIYRDGMGNVLGEVDKSMPRAERETTAGLAPAPEPVIDPVPAPFPEPDPLPAGEIELGQELEGELPVGDANRFLVENPPPPMEYTGPKRGEPGFVGYPWGEDELIQYEYDDHEEEPLPYGQNQSDMWDIEMGPGWRERGREREREYNKTHPQEQLRFGRPVPGQAPAGEIELGQDLEVDLAETELPLAIASDGAELVGGLPLVDAYHAMKVGEGPVLTEAQISQLPPELLVEARAWMAANVD